MQTENMTRKRRQTPHIKKILVTKKVCVSKPYGAVELREKVKLWAIFEGKVIRVKHTGKYR